MEYRILLTDGKHPDFVELTRLLDQDLQERYGELQAKYDKHNSIERIEHAVLVYFNSEPVGCGALKPFGAGVFELKRVFVRKEARKSGTGSKILHALFDEALQLGCSKMVLETGKKQHEAIALYHKLGFEIIENYGPYLGDENSVCMERQL